MSKNSGVPGGAKQKKEISKEELYTQQKERLALANIELPPSDLKDYLEAKDDLGPKELKEKQTMEEFMATIPKGYKRCGKCHHVKKLHLFNKNNSNKLCATGNCKACQKSSAAKSYAKTKKKRNYKKYYAEHKEEKQEQARKYYANNKEKVDARHKEYVASKAGKKVMKKAHLKRAKSIKDNQGIPYTRAIVLDRDCQGGANPICYLCGQPILDTTGTHCHLDHVVSLNNGGKDCFTNIAAVHKTCNLTKEKDDRNLEAEQVKKIIALSEEYMDKHAELFEEE